MIYKEFRILSLFKFLSLIFIYTIIQVIVSCENQYILDKETCQVNISNKTWLVDTVLNRVFYIADSSGNTEEYKFNTQWKEFDRREHSYGTWGLTGNELKQYEKIYQEYITPENEIFQIVLTASDSPFGDKLTIKLKDNNYLYRLKTKRLLAFKNNEGYSSGAEIVNDNFEDQINFNSEAIEHDTIKINGITYHNALEFILNDFEDKWKPSTTISIIVAKEIGLLQYRLNNGSVYNRVNRTNRLAK